MYNKISSFLLVAIFFGVLASVGQVAASSTVTLNIFGASSIWWVAVLPQNDNGLTTKVEVKDASMSTFADMPITAGWGYYTYTSTSGSGFLYPVTFRLTSSSGAQITTQVSSIVPNAVVDTGAVYGGAASTQAPSTIAPTTRPASVSTSAPTTRPASVSTSAPTTKPTSTPTTAPGLCSIVPTSSEPVKLLVPLYVYPGSAWDELIAAASEVDIIAIINPNSGPLTTVDSSYSTYMTKMHNAGITMIGYVHTSYGARAIADVQSDIATYASLYPLLVGIFVDEAATAASEISYYTEVYNAIIGNPGYEHAILNPGQQPDQGYLAVSTSILIYENYYSSLSSATYSSWVTCAPTAAEKSGYKYKFSGIVHTATAAEAPSIISTLHNLGMGLVYVTDGVGGCCTYNTLSSFFPQEASELQAFN
jgi:hypothetical protein